MCLLRELASDRPGARAHCPRHKLWGRVGRDRRIIASSRPMPQPVVMEPDEELEAPSVRHGRRRGPHVT